MPWNVEIIFVGENRSTCSSTPHACLSIIHLWKHPSRFTFQELYQYLPIYKVKKPSWFLFYKYKTLSSTKSHRFFVFAISKYFVFFCFVYVEGVRWFKHMHRKSSSHIEMWNFFFRDMNLNNRRIKKIK